MKKSIIDIKRTVMLIMLLIIITSCNQEFLEVEPKGSLIAGNTEDYDLLLNGVDINLFGTIRIDMSPEACMLEPHNAPATLITNNAFRWNADIYEPDDDILEFQDFVEQIYLLNKVITEVPNSSGGSEEKKKALEAEARAGRAWSYFQLANYFGKPYNAATASTDLCFPIIEKNDITKTEFKRATVQEVYDFILADLTAAIPNLPDMFWRIRMSKEAGHALLGKVYVFMGNYAQGLIELDAAFNAFKSAALEIDLYDYNVTTLPGGVHAPGFLGPGAVLAPADIQDPYRKQAPNFHTLIEVGLLLDPAYTALYGPTDLRLTQFLGNSPRFGPPFSVSNILRRKGPVVASWGIHVPDLYLLRAECKARTGDLEGAILDIEYLRKHRMPVEDASVPDGLTQNQLLAFIFDERFREFALQGHEWFTTRRLSTDPVFGNKTYTHKIYAADGSVKETFTLTPERMVLRFNQKIMGNNPNLINND